MHKWRLAVSECVVDVDDMPKQRGPEALLAVPCVRCANKQDGGGRWNVFGGRLAWDAGAICSNNPAFGGRGRHKTGDDYPAAPNIDHTQVSACAACRHAGSSCRLEPA
jgi:hypothetical protein